MQRKVINGVITAARTMLEATAEQKSIKRVVLTSSSTAAIVAKPNVHVVVTEGKFQTSRLPTNSLAPLVFSHNRQN